MRAVTPRKYDGLPLRGSHEGALFWMNSTLDDVQVTVTVPISKYPFDNIYADMLKRSGMKTDTRRELVEFIEAMMQAHDAVKALRAIEVATEELDRDSILRALRGGESIIDVAVMCQVELGEIVRCISRGAANIMETWGEATWAHVETVILQKGEAWSQRGLAEAADITWSSAKYILGWYYESRVPKS